MQTSREFETSRRVEPADGRSQPPFGCIQTPIDRFSDLNTGRQFALGSFRIFSQTIADSRVAARFSNAFVRRMKSLRHRGLRIQDVFARSVSGAMLVRTFRRSSRMGLAEIIAEFPTRRRVQGRCRANRSAEVAPVVGPGTGEIFTIIRCVFRLFKRILAYFTKFGRTLTWVQIWPRQGRRSLTSPTRQRVNRWLAREFTRWRVGLVSG